MNLIRVMPAKGSGQVKTIRFRQSGSRFQAPEKPLALPQGQAAFLLVLWEMSMELIVNGAPENLSSASLADFVQLKELPAASLVVELNRRIVPQGEWATTSLVAGDRLELLSFVGGG